MIPSALKRLLPRHQTPDIEPISPYTPMRAVCLRPPTQNLLVELPTDLDAHPSMMAQQEKRLLYGLASRYYSGHGLIVDAGIFLGASTACFAQGVMQNSLPPAARKRFKRPIVSFELGIVNPNMPAFFQRNGVPIDLAPGTSFADYVTASLAKYSNVVDLRIGDIRQTMRDISAPVEILFLDVLKSLEISKDVISHFFPLLRPGRSIVIQQDYFGDKLDYIKTHQEIFADYFEYLGEVCSSAVFRNIRQVPPEAIAALNSEVDVDDQERFASIAMQRSIDPMRRYLMAISKARLLRKTRGKSAGADYLKQIALDYPQEMIGEGRLSRLVVAMQEAEDYCRPVNPRLAAKQR